MELINGTKKVSFPGFNLCHLFFKNVKEPSFESLADSIYEFLYLNHATIVSLLIVGSELPFKKWKNVCNQTFGEINWDTTRIDDLDNQQTISGYVTCVGQITVKTIAGSNYISKILDTPNARLCFLATTEKSKLLLDKPTNVEQISTIVKTGLLFAGLKGRHILKLWVHTNSMEAISEELPGQLLGANNALFSLAQLKTNQKSETGISLLAIEEKNNEDSIKTKNTIVANVSLNSKEIVLNPSSILMLSAQFNYQQENLIENLETLTKYINNNGYDWQNCNRCMIYCESAAIKNKLKEYFKSLRIGMSAMLFVPGNLNLITFDCDFTKSKP